MSGSMMDISSDAKLRELSVKQAQAGREDKGDDSVGNLLNWNNLTYVMPTTNSVTSSRNRKRFDAIDYKQPKDLTGSETISIRLQTGLQYVDFRKSHLSLRVNLNVVATYNYTASFDFGVLGSVANLIDEVLITSRTGTVLSRIQNYSVWRAITHRFTKDADWFATVGVGMGYLDEKTQQIGGCNLTETEDPSKMGFATPPNKSVPASVHTRSQWFSIPLSELSPFFDSPQLCPQTLASGLEIQLRLKSTVSDPNLGVGKGLITTRIPYDQAPSTATAQKTGSDFNDLAITVTLNSPTAQYVPVVSSMNADSFHVILDTHTLMDGPQRALRDISSRNGLEYVYSQIFSHNAGSQSAISTSADSTHAIDFVVNKAVSRAMMAFCCVLPDVVGTEYDRDTTKSWPDPLLGYSPTSYLNSVQWRLGSQYYPHQELISNRNARAILDETAYAFGVKRSGDPTGIKLATGNYIGDWMNTERKVYGPFGISAVTFERSNLLDYSGSPLNNSRTLSFTGTVDTKQVVVKTVDGRDKYENYKAFYFLEYLSVCKAFLNNHVVTI